MAANLEGGNRPKEESMARLQREHDQLRKKYAGLEAAYEQTIRRLDKAEGSNAGLEQQHSAELINMAGIIREKIQSLEMNQLRNGEDLEDFKHQLKYDLSRQYQTALDELTSDLDQHRRSYSDLSLQHSILKAEFETLQRLLSDQEEKLRLKLSNQSTQFEAEIEALQARIQHLSAELASSLTKAASVQAMENGNGDEVKNLQEQIGDWSQKYAKLKVEYQKFQGGKERELEDLKRIVEDTEEEKQRLTSQVQRLEAEIIQEQRKRESADERYARAQRQLMEIREENDGLRRRSDIQSQEFNVQFAEKTMRLEKERDEKAIIIEELTQQTTVFKEQSNKFENLYRQAEIRIGDMEQKLKRDLEAHRDSWRSEKIELDAKIRQLENQRLDDDRASRERMQDLKLTLRRAEWEKERLADELAHLKVSCNERTKVTADNGPISTQEFQSIGSDHSDLSKLINRLSDQEQKFIDLSKQFDHYRQKHDRFRDIMQLVGNQIDRTSNLDEGIDAQVLINDLKGKVSQLLAMEIDQPGTSSSGKGEKRKSGRKEKVKISEE